jgi:predicted glycosyltransferase
MTSDQFILSYHHLAMIGTGILFSIESTLLGVFLISGKQNPIELEV